MSQARNDSAYHTFREIVSQPHVWQATVDGLDTQLASFRDLWRSQEQPDVLFTGCGSPYYLTRSAAVIFQGVVGTPATVAPASDLLLFPELIVPGKRPRMLVAVSRSGETTELLRAIKLFSERTGGPSVGVTVYPNTSLAQVTTQTLVAAEAHEQSIAQTRSFTSMFVTTQALINAITSDAPSAALQRLPEGCATLFDRYSALAEQLGRDPSLERFFFLGSGPLYGMACEAMLKMKEMSLSYSEAYHFLEFRHGPMSMVNNKSLVVGMVSERGVAHESAVLAEMRALGARVLAITPVELAAGVADYQVILPTGFTDLERGALYLPISQLMTFYRSLHNGLNPDAPTNLTAVVHLDFDAIEQTAPRTGA